MNKDDDDFFGIEEIVANSHYQPKEIGKNGKSSEFFDTAFFPGLEELKAEENKRPKISERGDFFEENFNLNSSRPEDMIKRKNFINLNKHIFSRSESPIDGSLKNEDEQQPTINGIKEIWGLMDPIWKYSEEELIQFMTQRIIYQTDDVVAFDKPFQLAYASGVKGQPQLDRLLEGIRRKIAPKSDRLRIVTSLDKASTGIIVFAKTKEKQLELNKLIEKDLANFRFRCLLKNVPEEERMRINIPLIKVVKEENFKLCPLSGEKTKPWELVYHLESNCNILNKNLTTQCSLADVFVKRAMPHLVRSHMYYGLNCPIVGDLKYKRHIPEHKSGHNFYNLSANLLRLINVKIAQARKLPLYLHLAEVHLPENQNGKFSVIRAELPQFFNFTLKKLNLLRK